RRAPRARAPRASDSSVSDTSGAAPPPPENVWKVKTCASGRSEARDSKTSTTLWYPGISFARYSFMSSAEHTGLKPTRRFGSLLRGLPFPVVDRFDPVHVLPEARRP